MMKSVRILLFILICWLYFITVGHIEMTNHRLSTSHQLTIRISIDGYGKGLMNDIS